MRQIIIILICLMFAGCQNPATNSTTNLATNPTSMKLFSPAFSHNQIIPTEYTCDGNNSNPPLNWSDLPAGTQSLALIVDDPDASAGSWIHWLLWNIDPAENSIAANSIPTGTTEGTTSFQTTGYGGPCPPSGTHHYHFKLYALDRRLDLPPATNKNQLEKAMSGHILDQTELIGLYQRIESRE